MAWSYDVNNLAGTNADVIYALKELLKPLGWTVTMSGGGTGSGRYNATGDCLTVASYLSTNLAWFVIRQPVAAGHPRREFLFQRRATHDGSYGTGVDIWVSPEDGFSSAGTDEDTKPATPADGRQIAGVAVSSHGCPLFPINHTYKYHMGADGAAPWGWYLIWTANGGVGTAYGVVFDPLHAGSFPTDDADPAIYVATEDSTYSSPFGTPLYSAGTAKWWYKKGLAGETWMASSHALPYNSGAYGTTVPNAVGANPCSSNREHFPIGWGRGAGHLTQVGWKGFLSVMRWTGADLVNFDTLAVAGVRTRIVVDLVTLPWPNVAPVL
jgi:hypothetical protein